MDIMLMLVNYTGEVEIGFSPKHLLNIIGPIRNHTGPCGLHPQFMLASTPCFSLARLLFFTSDRIDRIERSAACSPQVE